MRYRITPEFLALLTQYLGEQEARNSATICVSPNTVNAVYIELQNVPDDWRQRFDELGRQQINEN